jgi:hypothetical protein
MGTPIIPNNNGMMILMQLNLPEHTHFQSTACDIATTQIILDYYARPYTSRTLLNFLNAHAFGSLTTEIADCLQQHGVQTTIMTANPMVFSAEAWRNFFNDMSHAREYFDRFTHEFERVVKTGVYVIQKVPTIEMLEQELEAKRPFVMSFTSAPVRETLDTILHYAVVFGFNEDNFLMIDSFPNYEPTQIPKQFILNELQNITAGNPNSGIVILTQPRKS